MPNKRSTSIPKDPFGLADFQLLELILKKNAISRAALCTLARRGVAFRRAEPERAAKWLEQLSRHPLFKGGQFLFDLLEWEDFMLDEPPPAVVGKAEMLALLKRITRVLSSIQGQTIEHESTNGMTDSADASPLPPLESGFYLYRDVVLGALIYILEIRRNNV